MILRTLVRVMSYGQSGKLLVIVPAINPQTSFLIPTPERLHFAPEQRWFAKVDFDNPLSVPFTDWELAPPPDPADGLG